MRFRAYVNEPSRNKSIYFNAVLNILVFAYLVFISKFQTDPHHDGYIIGSSAAITKGMPPQAGAFSQYGPLTPLVAGMFMKVFGVNVISLRLLAAITVFVIYLILKNILERVGLDKKTSLLLGLFWVFANHITSTSFPGSNFFWPSLLSTFFLISALALLLQKKIDRKTNVLYFISGLFICLATFTRIQSGVVIALIFFGAILGWVDKKIAIKISTGFFLGVLLSVIFLNLSGAIHDFVNQVIVWPLFTYPSLGSGNNYNRFQFFIFLSLPIGTLMISWFLSRSRIALRNVPPIILFITITFILVIVQRSGSGILNSDLNAYVRLIVGDQLDRVIVWPYYLFFVICFVYVIGLLRKHVYFRSVSLNQFLILIFALSISIQIFPQPDIGHLWWMSPILIPTISLVQKERIIELFLNQTLPIFLASSLVLNGLYFLQPWREYEYKPFRGTFAVPVKVKAVSVYRPLESLDYSKKTIFLCHDGIHVVASGTYQSADKFFVDWGPLPKGIDEFKRESSTERIVICDKKRNICLT